MIGYEDTYNPSASTSSYPIFRTFIGQQISSSYECYIVFPQRQSTSYVNVYAYTEPNTFYDSGSSPTALHSCRSEDGLTYQWYAYLSSSSYNPQAQFNVEGRVYWYMAVG